MNGKGIYLWHPERMGSPEVVVEHLKRSKTQIACLKIIDGSSVWSHLKPYADAIRAAGIQLGAWGYVYLKWNALAEAKATVRAIEFFRPDFYLIDAEAEAKLQFIPAGIYAKVLRDGTSIPLGLASYWKPTYHPELPWKELRKVCNFDAPQVYWRGSGPVLKLEQSKAEFAAMKPRLPFALPGGDMFYERGLKPTPEQVTAFLDACRRDPEIRGCLMWSLDQMNIVPELWQAYSAYDWEQCRSEPVGPAPLVPAPLFTAVVTAWPRLNVRSGPSTNHTITGKLEQGVRVEAWKVHGAWVAIDQAASRWVHGDYLKSL